MQSRKQVEDCVQRIRDISIVLIRQEKRGYEILEYFMPEIQQVLQQMLKDFQLWISKGVELPLDIVATQMKNFELALRNGDRVMLADVLDYELGGTMELYAELLAECEVQG